MTIKWLSEKEAEQLFDVTFMDWANQHGYKGCYDPDETREEVVRARVWAAASPTAIGILNYVLGSQKTVYVVGMRGGYQCFNSTEGVNKDLPVVFIDLDGKLTVNVRGPHNLHLDPSKCVGTVMHNGVPHTNNTEQLNNWVALLHEFGHAKQWIETPSMFDNKAPGEHVKQPKWGLARQDKGGGQYDARLAKPAFATAIRNKAAERWKNSVCPRCGEMVDIDTTTDQMLNPKRDKVRNPRALHICSGKRNADTALIPTVEEVLKYDEKTNPTGYQPPVWGTKIEMDNMSRHEWPICRDLGLPIRVNYRDINATSDGAPSLTSQIRQKALVQAKADATLKVTAGPVQAGGLTGKVQCPRCGKMVGKMAVRFPCDDVRLHA